MREPRSLHMVKVCGEHDVLYPLELVVGRQLLRDDPDAVAHRAGFLRDVVARDRGPPAGDGRQSVEHLDRRGLARPVWSQEPEDFPLLDRERYVVHSPDLTVVDLG